MAVSPAEQLAKTKQQRKRNRSPQRCRAGKSPVRKRVWTCMARQLRESLGLSLRDVSGATGYTVSGLWEIERGTDPQLSTAAKLAEFYGRSVTELWPGKLAAGNS